MGEAGDPRPYQPEGGLRPEIEPGVGPPGLRTRVGLVLVRFGSSPWLRTPGAREGLSLAQPPWVLGPGPAFEGQCVTRRSFLAHPHARDTPSTVTHTRVQP